MKSARIYTSKQAELDIEEITVYLALDNPKAEEKFRNALETTLTLLATMPEIGSSRDFQNPCFPGLRMFVRSQ